MVAWGEKRIAYIVNVLQQMLCYYDDDDAPSKTSLMEFACLVIQLRVCGYKGDPLGLRHIQQDVGMRRRSCVTFPVAPWPKKKRGF